MDLSILIWINTHLVTNWGNYLFIFITNLWGYGLIAIPLSLYLFFYRQKRLTLLIMLTALIITLIFVNLGIKPIIERPRPFTVYPVELALSIPHGYSFPSSHTASVFAFVWAYFISEKNRLRWFLLVFAILVAFSRLYLFVHYPSDVLTGLIIGIICAYIGHYLILHYQNTNPIKKILSL